jgi:hypothetical protein
MSWVGFENTIQASEQVKRDGPIVPDPNDGNSAER